MSKHASGYPLVKLFADRIVDTVREIFVEGNDFCKKVSYCVGKKTAEASIAEFRTSPRLGVGVTLYMIATDTVIKPLEVMTYARCQKPRLLRANEGLGHTCYR
tara:strand:+ start:7284 stop:7592 length:309 start_codon:yes stop_codon:yes gene_type:complete